ncbi:hypothetical protein ACIQ57_24565 [Lysinibacillus xylanilyticus]|uniref:hypothetical protein n=1 Tax=Lysinibacillus xylanilyticus TaxID=582475 RepID=UPI0037FC10B5
MVENEENVKELEDNEAKTDATEQKETTNTEEKSHNTEKEAKEEVNSDSETGTEETPVDPVVPVVPEQILEEQKQQYTTELIENDNFTLEIAHQITVGDMLVSTLLAANIAVLLLCRLIRDRK